MLPKSHFYVRTRKDADPKNPGAHPLIAIKVEGHLAAVAACSPQDAFSRAIARKIVTGRFAAGQCVPVTPTDTIESVLRAAGVPRKILRNVDMDRAAIAFERALEG